MQNLADDGCAYFTKRVRIPKDKISGIRQSPSGVGCAIETDRGVTFVMESYEEAHRIIFGGDCDDNIKVR